MGPSFFIGQKIKFIQNGATVYGIVTAISFSTNTTLTLYCGTDYDVLDTATYPITDFKYSTQKAPFGFPLDPDKWTVELKDTTDKTQASPTTSTWYNLGSLSIDIPIGVWEVTYQVMSRANGVGNDIASRVTLSTGSASESNPEYTTRDRFRIDDSTGIAVKETFYEKTVHSLALTAKDTFYLNMVSDSADINADIKFMGTEVPTIIRAVCAYL